MSVSDFNVVEVNDIEVRSVVCCVAFENSGLLRQKTHPPAVGKDDYTWEEQEHGAW